MERKEEKSVTVHVKPAPPALASVTPLEMVAGKNPEAINLKDNEWLDGKTVIIVEVKPKEGNAEMGPYIIFGAYVVDAPDIQPTEEDFHVLMTGSENVMERTLLAAQEKALPVSGVLRQAGRAWFLD